MDVPTSDSVPRPTVTIADAIGFLSRYSPVLAGALAGWAWSAGASLAFCSILFAVGLLVSAIVSIAAIDANLGLLRKGHASSDTFMDKTVLIVGASRGVGAALAQHLANQGAILILASRNEADLQAVKNSCSGPNTDRITVLPMDVMASGDALVRFALAADAIHGGIHYAFLAAGSSQSAAAEETSHVVGQEVLRLNAEGVIAVGRALLRQMLERQMGRLVVIASMAAKIPSPGQAEYSAAKHALIGYFLSVAAELADRCVGVTVVCPGPIGGEKSRSVFGPSGRIVKSESEKDQNKKVPMARCCQLICDAAAHQVAEAWIAKHPVLGLAYLVQWLPGAATAVLARVGPKRARALSEGRSGYEYDLARKEE